MKHQHITKDIWELTSSIRDMIVDRVCNEMDGASY